MDWDTDEARLLQCGVLLKTAGGQGGEVKVRPKSAKKRYFRLIAHEARSPPVYVLYYHDSIKARSQKGHIVIDSTSIIKQGWEEDSLPVGSPGTATSSLPKRHSNSSSPSSVPASPRSSSSGNLLAAIASTASKNNALRVVNENRILYIMVPPQVDGDRNAVAAKWREALLEARAAARDQTIMKPTDFTTVANVQFDAKSQTFDGVPENMAQDFVNAAFNLPLTHTTFVKVPGYDAPGIPLMLVLLKEFLVNLNGLREPGIFRIAPEKMECEKAKRAACLRNREELEYVMSPHVFANLIKQWLRDMPGGLLNRYLLLLGFGVFAYPKYIYKFLLF